MIKKSAIVDKVTVDAQDARVKKMMKLETWFSEEAWNVEQQQTASVQQVNSVDSGGQSREDDWVR